MRRIALLLLLTCLFSIFTVGCNNLHNEEINRIEIPPTYEEQFDDVTYAECIYILNKNTHKFHYKDCYTIDQMSQKNKVYCDDDRTSIIQHNYVPCKKCNP